MFTRFPARFLDTFIHHAVDDYPPEGRRFCEQSWDLGGISISLILGGYGNLIVNRTNQLCD